MDNTTGCQAYHNSDLQLHLTHIPNIKKSDVAMLFNISQKSSCQPRNVDCMAGPVKAVVHNVRPASSRHVARYPQLKKPYLATGTLIKSAIAHNSNFATPA